MLFQLFRDAIGSTQAELTTTKQLYVGVCKVKDNLEYKVHSLQVDDTCLHRIYLNNHFPD